MKQEHIQQMLDRYIDGLSTDEEEEQLRRYFSSTDIVPAEWRPYKALFSWEQQQRAAQSVAAPRQRSRRWAWAAAIAAFVVAGAGVATTMMRQGSETMPQDGTAPQAYAIIDGVVSTDAATIATEAELALSLVSANEEETFEALNILEI